MKNTLCRAKSVENKKLVEGYYFELNGTDYIIEKGTGYFDINCGESIFATAYCHQVIPETLSRKIEDVKWFWKNENFIENIDEAYLNDVVEFYHDGDKHIGYLDMEYGCLMLVSATLWDGYVWVHDLGEDLVEDIDEYRYITAKLLGNRFDNNKLLDKEEE